MNEAKAIELALAKTIRQFSEIGQNTLIRPWQSLRSEMLFEPDNIAGDRHFPCIDIRCAHPTLGDDQSTMTTTATIIIATAVSADPDHSSVSAIYQAVKETTDALFKQFRRGIDGDELTMFKTEVQLDAGPEFHFGGISYGSSSAPYDDSGINVIDIGVTIFHANTDY